ncbi:MAG: hypothetical protein V1895_02900 [Parcubacteria group bacterium]
MRLLNHLGSPGFHVVGPTAQVGRPKEDGAPVRPVRVAIPATVTQDNKASSVVSVLVPGSKVPVPPRTIVAVTSTPGPVVLVNHNLASITTFVVAARIVNEVGSTVVTGTVSHDHEIGEHLLDGILVRLVASLDAFARLLTDLLSGVVRVSDHSGEGEHDHDNNSEELLHGDLSAANAARFV